MKTLYKLAQDLSEQYSEPSELRRHLRNRLSGNLSSEMLSELVDHAISNVTHEVRHTRNSDLKKEARAKAAASYPIRSIVGLEAIAKLCILERQIMPNGKKLGDSTGSECRTFAEKEIVTANGHLQNSSFWNTISDKVPAKGKVRNYLKGDEADKLFESIVTKEFV